MESLRLLRCAVVVAAGLALALAPARAAGQSPSITGFSPRSGPVGTSVTMAGSGFGGVANVYFGDAPASRFSANTAGTRVTAIVPSGAPSGPLTVVTPVDSATSSASFEVLPQIRTVAPLSGPEGSIVTLTGTTFSVVAAVEFGGAPAAFGIDSDTQITALAPEGGKSGPISITSWSGARVTSQAKFKLTPGISGLDADAGFAGDSVTISGSRLGAVSAVRFGGVAAAFRRVDAHEVTTVVPARATTGKIIVSTPEGRATSGYDFVVRPRVTSIRPTIGSGGDVVSINGSGFSAVHAVDLNGVHAAYRLVSSNRIDATVPQSASSGPIVVSTDAGDAEAPGRFTIRPVISSLSPATGRPGTTVAIVGTSLGDAAEVKFGGVGASFSVDSPTRLTAIVPDTAGSGPVTVVTHEGATAASAARFRVLPTVIDFSPRQGPEGTRVTITGSAFAGTSWVKFNGKLANFERDGSSLVATVPAGASSGPITVQSDGVAAASAASFHVVPGVAALAPTSGGPGTSVGITGTSFTGATSVTFGGAAAAFTVDSPTHITATVPAGAATGKVAVATAEGIGESGGVFVFAPPPVIERLSATTTAVGHTVRIEGSELAGATSVSFSGSAPTPGLVTDLTWGISNGAQDRTVAEMQDAGTRWTRLSVQWKAWETSPGKYTSWEVARTDRAIQLCNEAGIHVLLDVLNAPAWASNTNDSGQGNVPRNPADFANFMRMLATRYKGKVDAYELWNEPDIPRFWNTGPSATEYTKLLKAGYAAVKSADSSALVVSAGLSWEYSGFLGRMYTAGAKGYFDVIGLHPYPTGSLDDWPNKYRAARATQLANGDPKPIWLTEIGFNTSTNSSGWQPGVSPDEQAQRLTDVLRMARDDPYVQLVFYYSLRNSWWEGDNPSSTEANFGLVRTDFTRKPAYYTFRHYARSFGPPQPSEPRILTGDPGQFTQVSDTAIDVVVPDGALTGPIAVTTAGGTAVSAPITIVSQPSITGFSPSSGITGTPVTITGEGFTGVSDVRFGGVPSSFTVESDTEIAALVPEDALSGTVFVTNAAGTAVSAGSFTVTSPPAIAAFTPTEGALGTTVTISGVRFARATVVAFGDTDALVFTVDSETQITADVPPGAGTGPISVTTPYGTGTSSASFTVLLLPPVGTGPAISGFSPAQGRVGDEVTVSGSGFSGATSITVGGIPVTPSSLSDSELTFAVPDGAVSGPITVTTPEGTAASPGEFAVLP